MGSGIDDEYKPANIVPLYLDPDRRRVDALVQEVKIFDREFNLGQYDATTIQSLMYCLSAMVGEAGEALNELKKLIRDHAGTDWDYNVACDPNTPVGERMQKLMTEMVDVGIYFGKTIELIERATGGKINFDQAWVDKHVLLAERFAAKNGRRAEGSE
jgi:hypothetical protein